MLTIEFEAPTESTCECCGNVTVRLTRFVYRNGDAYAVYYAQWTAAHGEKRLVVCSRAVTLGCCSIREHPVESGRRPGVASSHISIRRSVAGAGDRLPRTIRVWDVPSSHENDRLSWPDRQTLRRTSDYTELEHDREDCADPER